MPLEKTVAQLLMTRNKTLSIAESCTGGLVTHLLTNIPGSSKFLKVTIVAYSNEAKIKLFKISPRLLQQYGAVSEQTATAMAKAVRRIHKTNFGIGITGIAGPTGATKAKPVGLTYIAISTTAKTLCLPCLFSGTRIDIKRKAAHQALRLLQKYLS